MRGALHQILRHLELDRDRVEDWSVHPFSIPAVRNLERLELSPGVTIFVGENGSGKSTLLEALAIKCGFNPEGGTKNFAFAHRPSESNLSDYLRVARGVRREKGGFFLRAETMFNVATAAEQYRAYGWDDLHEKSHGEAFLWVFMNRFHAGGLYLLDEPEAALSPQRQLTFLARLHQLVCGGAQLVLATHSPMIMAYPGARIYLFDGDGIREVSYEETEHYTITRAFLTDRERMLRTIFDGLE